MGRSDGRAGRGILPARFAALLVPAALAVVVAVLVDRAAVSFELGQGGLVSCHVGAGEGSPDPSRNAAPAAAIPAPTEGSAP